jgi:hypothetical protein
VGHVSGIEGIPFALQEDLEPGAEVHWRRVPGYTDITKIAGAVAGRVFRATAQRDGQVSKVAADADLLQMSFGRHAVAAGVVVAELDPLMDVIADRLHSLPTAGVGSKKCQA